MSNQETNKNFNINLSLEFDMENQTPVISNIEIQKNPEQMSYKEKIIAYFERDVATRLEKWKNYKNCPEVDASTPLLIQKRLAEEQYIQANQTLEILKLL
jgi:hypothetical protein